MQFVMCGCIVIMSVRSANPGGSGGASIDKIMVPKYTILNKTIKVDITIHA